jgi:hypothetical protein
MNESTKSPLETKIFMEENSNRHGRGLRTESSSWRSLKYEMSGQSCYRRGGPFIAPQGNLAVGVSETRTCSGWGPDMSGQPL